MASRFPRLSFEHQELLGRPSCPKCGQLCLFPERMGYTPGRIWNSWQCDGCTARFQTSAVLAMGIERPFGAA
jgi:hypothetical protein